MRTHKERLYVALYARGGTNKETKEEVRYHWALMTGPRLENENSRGMRYHVKNLFTAPTDTTWQFEECNVPVGYASKMLMVRILIGKIENNERLQRIVRSVPVAQGNTSWNGRSWVKSALGAIRNDGKAIGTCQLDWSIVQDAALKYVTDKKRQHRFDGKAKFDMSKSATYDLLGKRETIM